MNNKKSRVTDLFRKMDTDNDGAVPREDFIDGIIKTSKYSEDFFEQFIQRDFLTSSDNLVLQMNWLVS